MTTLLSLQACAIIVFSFLQLAPADLYEGSRCTQKDGSSGVCRTIKTCKWIKDHKILPQSYVTCCFVGSDAVICCNDEILPPRIHRNLTAPNEDAIVFRGSNRGQNTTTMNPTVVTLPTMDRIKERKSVIACNLYNEEANQVNFLVDNHILNGVSADPGEFPHMAAIGYRNELNEVSYDCGGSLISSKFVLSAAHCVNKRNRQPSVVRLGKITLLNDEDDLVAQDINIKKIYIHPQYTARQKYNDISLIELQDSITFTKFVNPACLSSQPDSVEQKLIISGYGVMNQITKTKSNVLLKASVNSVPIEDCTKYFQEFSWYKDDLPQGIIKSQLCAIDLENNSDTCQGDSGGPIQYDEIVKAERREYIVGLTSFGVHCGSHLPSMYTRVSEYLNWIEEKVWPGEVTLNN